MSAEYNPVLKTCEDFYQHDEWLQSYIEEWHYHARLPQYQPGQNEVERLTPRLEQYIDYCFDHNYTEKALRAMDALFDLHHSTSHSDLDIVVKAVYNILNW